MLENKWLIGISVFIIGYFILKFILINRKPGDYQKEIADILNKDKYKVKGRFE